MRWDGMGWDGLQSGDRMEWAESETQVDTTIYAIHTTPARHQPYNPMRGQALMSKHMDKDARNPTQT